MTRLAAAIALALACLFAPTSIEAQVAPTLGRAGGELTRTLPPTASADDRKLETAAPSAPSADDFCTLRPFFRASLGGGAGILLESRRSRSESYLWPVGIEGLGRLDLVFGHDIAADPGLRIQIQYRAVGFGNETYVAHRHLLELTMGLGSVFQFHAGGGATVRHGYQGGTLATGTIAIGIDWTIDAFVISLDLLTLDFLPGVLEWTPSLSLGFQIR